MHCIVAVERICKMFLASALNQIMGSFPFVIRNFPSDCGSEYINRKFAEILEKLLIDQTKSRAPHCYVSALVEPKSFNGSQVSGLRSYSGASGRFGVRIYPGRPNALVNNYRSCFFFHKEEEPRARPERHTATRT
jgi:hypothetical protein